MLQPMPYDYLKVLFQETRKFLFQKICFFINSMIFPCFLFLFIIIAELFPHLMLQKRVIQRNITKTKPDLRDCETSSSSSSSS